MFSGIVGGARFKRVTHAEISTPRKTEVFSSCSESVEEVSKL